MNQPRIKILLWITAVLAVVCLAMATFAFVLALRHRNVPETPSNDASECTKADAPCIAILDNAGHVFARVNDFRFGTQGCIFYRATTADKWRQHCGGYTMQWIGPQPAPGTESRI